MIRTSLSLTLYSGLALLALAACNDTSNIGLGLVGEQVEPRVEHFKSSILDTTTIEDITGASLRVLAGRVEDPLIGTFAATGYVDVGGTLPEGSQLIGADLILQRDYLYGDSTTQVTLALREIAEEWVATGATADTTLPLGDLVTEFNFLARNNLVTVPLPEDWVLAHREAFLRDLATEFHGFALEAVGTSAVVGFDYPSSSLRFFTETDTLVYGLLKTITGLTKEAEVELPPNRILVQDGLGPSVTFNFDFSAADLQDMPLNGALIRLFVDTERMQDKARDFVRPRPESIQLVRIDPTTGLPFLVEDGTFDEQGHLTFTGITLRDVVQGVLFGEDLIDRFEIRFSVSDDVTINENVIGPLLLYDATLEETMPEVALTLSPLVN